MSASQTMPKAMRALEVLIAVSLLLIMLLSALATVKDQASLGRWLDSHSLILGAVGLGECASLLLWMVLGGQRSNLWNWLPPFCFFPKVLWIRWLSVIAVTAGTIAGIVATPRGHEASDFPHSRERQVGPVAETCRISPSLHPVLRNRQDLDPPVALPS